MPNAAFSFTAEPEASDSEVKDGINVTKEWLASIIAENLNDLLEKRTPGEVLGVDVFVSFNFRNV